MSEGILQLGTTTFNCQCKNKRSLIRTTHLVVYSGALSILFFEICTRNVVCRTTPNTAYTIHVHDPLSWIPYQKPDNSQLRENPLFVTQKHTEQPSVGSLGTVISIMSTHKTSCSMLVVIETNFVDCALSLLFQRQIPHKSLCQCHLFTYMSGSLRRVWRYKGRQSESVYRRRTTTQWPKEKGQNHLRHEYSWWFDITQQSIHLTYISWTATRYPSGAPGFIPGF
jgi:hypothetical protein